MVYPVGLDWSNVAVFHCFRKVSPWLREDTGFSGDSGRSIVGLGSSTFVLGIQLVEGDLLLLWAPKNGCFPFCLRANQPKKGTIKKHTPMRSGKRWQARGNFRVML